MSEQRDKNLWIFNAGNSFAGNPKSVSYTHLTLPTNSLV